MAISVTALQAKVPAGTPTNAPATVPLAITTAYVNKIRWRVPPGPRGHLGWYLSMGGVQVLPDDQGAYVVADDEYDDWEIENLPDSGAWQLTGYNTGSYDHTVYLYFFTTPVQLSGISGGGDILAGFPFLGGDTTGIFT